MHKYREGQKEFHCIFVDLKKTYDWVQVEELWFYMRVSGGAEKYVRLEQDMHEHSMKALRCTVGVMDSKVEVRPHQGLALRPSC